MFSRLADPDEGVVGATAAAAAAEVVAAAAVPVSMALMLCVCVWVTSAQQSHGMPVFVEKGKQTRITLAYSSVHEWGSPVPTNIVSAADRVSQ